MRSSFTLAVLAGLASTLWAQDASQRAPADVPATAPQNPIPAGQVPPVVGALPNVQPWNLGTDGGALGSFPATLDDSIPLPVPAQVKSTPAGDVIVDPASGDPFFLGFAGGSYYPPAGESVDPLLVQTAQSHYGDGRPQQETYAFVMFEKRITPRRIAELESLGARVLSFHPHYCLKVALPVSSIDAIAAHEAVRWVGIARPQQKLHPRLVEDLSGPAVPSKVDVYIDVFDSDLGPESTTTNVGSVSLVDHGAVTEGPANPEALPKTVMSNGWQQAALQGVGVEVREYVDSIRAFRAHVAPSALEVLAALDFVQFVEPDLPRTSHHDESTPLISTDYTRIFNNGAVSAAVTGGIIDSGVYSPHVDFGHMNGVGWDFSGSPGGAWSDGCGHGSHVAGTILGDGSGIDDNRGNAPGLGNFGWTRFFNAKIFRDNCTDPAPSYASVLSVMHNGYWDGVFVTPRPMVINNSYGVNAGASAWKGTEAEPRMLDDEVYWNIQNYVFSAGNQGATGKIGLHASAKNVLTVGNVSDYRTFGITPGQLAWDSSQGPVGDGRWKPNVCAPGERIDSVSSGTSNGYILKNGTSMAAPHVTGAIANLLDAYSWLRYAPARVDSLVMASAVTRNNQVLTVPSETHHNQFGTGRVDAWKMIYGSSELGWTNWGFSLAHNTYTWADFTVPAGCTRLVVCMNYKEAQCSSGASKALVNNWDLYLDQAPIDPNMNTGDWFAQQSSVDNTEIRIIDSPQAGAWRWKTWPTATTSGADFGVTVYFFVGDTTPDPTVWIDQNKFYARPFENVDLTGYIYNPSTLASAVFLESGTTNDSQVVESARSMFDVPYASFTDNLSGGRYVGLGNMLHGATKGNFWRMYWTQEGVKFFGVFAGSDNAVNKSVQTSVTIDGTPPSTPASLTSSSHTPFAWSNDPYVYVDWSPSTDNLAGVAGYSVAEYLGQPGQPDSYIDTSGTSWAFALPSTGQDQYLSVIAIDYASNESSFAAAGPFRIDTDLPSDPTNVISTTHTPGVETCDSYVSMQWDDSYDLESGVYGYTVLFDTAPDTDLTGQPLTHFGLGNTAWSQSLPATPYPWYFHVATQDVAGNWSTTVHAGPYYTMVVPFTYCTAKVNSLGCTPYMTWAGAPSASASSGFTVYGYEVRNNKSGLLFYGVNGQAALPHQGGTLCVAPSIKRTPSVNSGGSASGNDCSGVYTLDMNSFAQGLLGGTPLPALSVPGTTINCQWWGRDPGFPAPGNTTLTDGLQYVICN